MILHNIIFHFIFDVFRMSLTIIKWTKTFANTNKKRIKLIKTPTAYNNNCLLLYIFGRKVVRWSGRVSQQSLKSVAIASFSSSTENNNKFHQMPHISKAETCKYLVVWCNCNDNHYYNNNTRSSLRSSNVFALLKTVAIYNNLMLVSCFF